MNFLSHYFLDRNTNDNCYFFAGLCVPDLLSLYARIFRIPFQKIEFEEEEKSDYNNFLKGLKRHEQVDGLFHNSEFFRQQMRNVSELLRAQKFHSQNLRSFFLAHIVVELMLDKILIQRYPELLDDYYKTLERVDLNLFYQFLNQMNQKWMGTDEKNILTLKDAMQRFCKRKFLTGFVNRANIIFALNRMRMSVGLDELSNEDKIPLDKVLMDYEQTLAFDYQEIFIEIRGKSEG